MNQIDLTGIEESKKPIFFCSFGKDSSAVLHALKPWLYKTMVVFIDCGGAFPDVVEWADEAGAKLPHYFHIHPTNDIWKEIRSKGWSVDMEFADLGRHSDTIRQVEVAGRHKTRPWTQCVYERLWIPGFVFTQMYKPDLYISGEKKSDRPYANDWETRTNGIANSLRPVFNWTDDEVWEYIDENKIELPVAYNHRDADRRDCYLCFGAGLTVNRIKFLKEQYPDLYNKVFHEEGFAELVPVMVDQLKKAFEVWSDIQGLIRG